VRSARSRESVFREQHHQAGSHIFGFSFFSFFPVFFFFSFLQNNKSKNQKIQKIKENPKKIKIKPNPEKQKSCDEKRGEMCAAHLACSAVLR
jgi:hypothetical protein